MVLYIGTITKTVDVLTARNIEFLLMSIGEYGLILVQ